MHSAVAHIFFLMLFFVSSAHAGQVSLIPSGPMIADGTSAVTVHIWVPGLQDEDKMKIKPAHGKIISIERQVGGMVVMKWVPARIGHNDISGTTNSSDVPVEVMVRKRGQDPVTTIVHAPLTTPTQGSISIQTEPAEWAPGQDAVQVKFKLEGTSRQLIGDRRILISSSVGTLTEPMPLGDGTFAARWTPPETVSQARTAIISAVESSTPSTIAGFVALPMLAKTNLSFGATPDSQNMLTIGDRTYGPMTASPAGTVAFDVLAHPAVRSGTMASTLRDGRSSTVAAPLPLQEYPRVTFLPQPQTVPTGSAHTILLAATTAAGAPLDGATITIQTDEATLGTASATSVPGIYGIQTTISGDARVLNLHAKMNDPNSLINKMQKTSSSFNVIAGLPTAVLTADPNPIPHGETKTSLSAQIEGANGVPLREIRPGFAHNGKALGRTANRGNGQYSLAVSTPLGSTKSESDNNGPITAAVVPQLTPSALSAAGVVVWTAATSVGTNESIPVMVAALDAFGVPVPNVDFVLSAPGGGSFPENIKSGDSGIAVAMYSASASPGLFTINATGAGYAAQAAVFQGDESAGPRSIDGGDGWTQTHRNSMMKVVGVVRVTSEAAPAPPPVVVAPPPAPVEPAPAPVVTAPPPVVTAPPPVVATPAAAPAAAAPAAAAPVAAPAPRPPKVRTPRTGGPIDLQATAALAAVYHRFQQTADGTTDTLPADAGYTRPASPGVDLRVLAWLNSEWGAEVRFRGINDVITIGDMIHGQSSWNLTLGGRRIFELNDPDMKAYALAGLQRTQTNIFQFTTDSGRSEMAPAVKGLTGAQAGGGILMELPNNLSLDAQLAELFAPYPVATHLGGQVLYNLNADWNVHGGLDIDIKHVGMSIDGTALKVRDTEVGMSAGVTWMGL